MWSWTGSPARFRSSNNAGGFTLIEVLVAFAILALTLAALFQVFSGGLRNVAAADRHLMATMLARSVLDDVGSEIPIVSGERSGEIEQGYRWTVRILPSTAIAPVADAEWVLVPYEVQVEISWNGRPVTVITTLRLAAELGLPFDGSLGDPSVRQ
jgi:general secretion pathway protein I